MRGCISVCDSAVEVCVSWGRYEKQLFVNINQSDEVTYVWRVFPRISFSRTAYCFAFAVSFFCARVKSQKVRDVAEGRSEITASIHTHTHAIFFFTTLALGATRFFSIVFNQEGACEVWTFSQQGSDGHTLLFPLTKGNESKCPSTGSDHNLNTTWLKYLQTVNKWSGVHRKSSRKLKCSNKVKYLKIVLWYCTWLNVLSSTGNSCQTVFCLLLMLSLVLLIHKWADLCTRWLIMITWKVCI